MGIDFVNVAAADKSRQSSTDVRRSTDAGTVSVDNSSDGFVSVPTSPTATNAGELSDEKRRSSTGSALTMPSMPASPPETSGVLVWRTEKQLDVANAAQTLLDALRDVDSDAWRSELQQAHMSSAMWRSQLQTVVDRLQRAVDELAAKEARAATTTAATFANTLELPGPSPGHHL